VDGAGDLPGVRVDVQAGRQADGGEGERVVVRVGGLDGQGDLVRLGVVLVARVGDHGRRGGELLPGKDRVAAERRDTGHESIAVTTKSSLKRIDRGEVAGVRVAGQVDLAGWRQRHAKTVVVPGAPQIRGKGQVGTAGREPGHKGVDAASAGRLH